MSARNPAFAWLTARGRALGLALCLVAELAILVPAPAAADVFGIDTNSLGNGGVPVTANYTIATTDAGKTIQAGTGSTGFFTITVPSVSGFPANTVVILTNGDTVTPRGKA